MRCLCLVGVHKAVHLTVPLNCRVLKKANFKHFLTECSRELCNPNVRLCPSVSIKSGLGMSDDFVL